MEDHELSSTPRAIAEVLFTNARTNPLGEAVTDGVDRVTWLTALSLLPLVWIGGRIGLRVGDKLGEAAAAALALAVLGAAGLYTLAAAARAALW